VGAICTTETEKLWGQKKGKRAEEDTSMKGFGHLVVYLHSAPNGPWSGTGQDQEEEKKVREDAERGALQGTRERILLQRSILGLERVHQGEGGKKKKGPEEQISLLKGRDTAPTLFTRLLMRYHRGRLRG